MKLKFVLFILFISISCFGQTKTENSKALKFFDKANNFFLAGDTANSILFCNKAIKKDSLFTEPYVLKSQILFNNKYYKQAINLLSKILIFSPDYVPIYYIIGHYLITDKQYDKAIIYLQNYISLEDNLENIKLAKRNIEICKFRIFSFQNPVMYKPLRLNEKINTNKSEYFPTVSTDNESIIFTRMIEEKYRQQEDIYIYIKNQNKSVGISSLINTKANEGAHTISVDGRVMIFTRCTPEKGCDLFISSKDLNDNWSKPVRLPPPVNTRYWESQASLAPDGKTLYFVSNRPGGKGKMDIWSSVFNENGIWSRPQNLGDSINTIGNEMSPFMHYDNQTMYFSSDYHIGMGKYDIFKSTKINDSTWTKPYNIGYPINTEGDEYRFVVIPSGDIAYFSSQKDTIFKQDIYSLKLQNNIKPNKTIYLKVLIYSDLGFTKAKADFISVTNLENYDTIYYSRNQSEILTCFPTNSDYALNILKKGYLFYSKDFSLKNISDTLKCYEIKVFLKPIKINEIFSLNNIFFETNSYQINPKSFPELYKFTEFLKMNANLQIQVNGHTDNVGSYDYNMTLSLNRANEIKKFLVENGIDEKRIKIKGFGFSKPIADNNIEKGRKQNRRTEILILKK